MLHGRKGVEGIYVEMVRFFAGDPEFDANEYRAMSLDPSGDSVPVLQLPRRSIQP